MRRLPFVILACAALSACGGTWFGEPDAPPLPGERIAILGHDQGLEPDLSAQLTPVTLPPPVVNAAWPQAGGSANHAMHHLALAETPQRVWSASMGSGSTGRVRLLGQPVVADGRAYAIDVDNTVTAVDAGNGRSLWRVNLRPQGESGQTMGGGVAVDGGRVFATTGFGEVVALDAATGEEAWRVSVGAPLRAAPTVAGGRVFVITIDNRTHALSSDDGRTLWTHSGFTEVASVLGAASAAVDGNVVVVPYSSGELYALRVENGAVLWAESLSTIRRTEAVTSLTDIRARPIIDRGRLYAVGNADMMAAVDMRSGRRIWERQIGSIQSPWIAGDYLFLVSNALELVALEAATGRIAWVTPLQQWENERNRTGRLIWAGPVLAGDKLIVTSSHGWAVSVSPTTGEVLGRERLPGGVTISPIVAGETLYFLTEDANLVAYR
ncbi:PQQ-binding-like beta-propeller repeat protein [Telmatospirillum sp. J64-1]|uniref:outer membrane protein assembly factor BamB family protein n=1 Tax=Telmatospirillum sp. J64-1 TaxID=2502183 RepID=UPI00115D23B5|nr:PQQ-binding-like beta-propeller repeat protein [Telmatospirillum sp. J64-1]